MTARAALRLTGMNEKWYREGQIHGSPGVMKMLVFETENGVLVKYHGYEKHVVIPKGVTRIAKKAFSRRKEYVESLVIPEGVTEIDPCAFMRLPNLTAVTLPGSLKTVPGHAFDGCGRLQSLFLSDGVQEIDEGAFSGCTSLQSVAFPDSITRIGPNAFDNCSALSSFTLPDRRVDLSQSAFRGTKWFLDAPDGVIYAGKAAYLCKGDCPAEVVLLPGTEAVCDYAFYFCKSLVSLTIPDGVRSIGKYAFYSCQRLSSVFIPDTVETIGDDAFGSCISLQSISFARGLKSIGKNAFSACLNLKIIFFADSPLKIGDFAFSNCKGLQSVTIPGSVTEIGTGAFGSIPGLTLRGKNGSACKKYAREHRIPFIEEKAVIITDGVLRRCSGLPKDFTVPDTVTEIDAFAFAGCDELVSVTIPGSVKSIPNSLFKGIKSLKSVTLNDGLTEIGFRAFNECSGLQNVTIPVSVLRIGGQAFADCSSLEKIAIPAAVTEIGSEAFWGCDSLTAFDVSDENRAYASEDGVLYVKDRTKLLRFPPGSRQETFVIPGHVTEIASCAFQGSRNLKRVMVPAGVKRLNNAFAWCESLEGAVLCGGVTEIGSSAFYSCKSLQRVIIPDSVTEIGTGAFHECTSLNSIILPESVAAIGEGAFYGCHLKEITIPAGVRSIGKKAFGYWRMFWEYKDSIVIFGKKGSAAEQYARDNGFGFVSM